MIRDRRAFSLSALFVVISLAGIAWTMLTGNFSIGAEQAKVTGSNLKPVDDDMHHFMEYVFEPNYKRLKAGMADQPKDKRAWKAIKGDSLTLAECANLLLMRVPGENADEWLKLSAAVRTLGGELYQSARQSDYSAARKAYVNMLNKCNTCHKQFADGEHQLRP